MPHERDLLEHLPDPIHRNLIFLTDGIGDAVFVEEAATIGRIGGGFVSSLLCRKKIHVIVIDYN